MAIYNIAPLQANNYAYLQSNMLQNAYPWALQGDRPNAYPDFPAGFVPQPLFG
jgi:hypothetical protein